MPLQHGAVQTVRKEEWRRLSQLPPQHGGTPLPLLQRGLLQRPVQAHLSQEGLQRYAGLAPLPALSTFNILTFTNLINKHTCFLGALSACDKSVSEKRQEIGDTRGGWGWAGGGVGASLQPVSSSPASVSRDDWGHRPPPLLSYSACLGEFE